MRYISLVSLCLLISTARAQDAPTTRPARGDTVVCSTVIDAPADEIFDCFRTPDGIVRAWGVAKAKVDFRVGGQIRTAYAADADLDSDKCIVNTILAYVPGRMLAIKPTPPAGAPDWLRAICDAGWNVITLEEIGPGRTRVTVTGMGYGQGELFDKAYAFFEQGNAATLQFMRKSLGRSGDGDAGDRSAKAVALFKSAAGRGGVWTAEETFGGKPFRARVEYRLVHDGRFVEARGSIGDDVKLNSHALFVCGVDPATGAGVFTQYMETGAIARGTMWLLDDGKTVASDWHFTTVPAKPAAGSLAEKYPDVRFGAGPAPWHITFEFADDDHYTVRMWRSPTPQGEPAITVNYRRVAPPPPPPAS